MIRAFMSARSRANGGTLISSDYAENWPEPIQRHLQRLTFWRRNIYFLILAHPVYKTGIVQEPNTLESWNKLYFGERKKNEEYIPCLKYSVPIFVE